MARKSRRQSELVKEEITPKEKVFKTALYVRLSIEDVRDRKDSDSIENQTYLLKQFVEERPYLQVHSIYTDNGEKGTNFDRPEFNRLMEDIKAQKVNCIIVKDLSRFGRDYLETGNYLEKIFPFLGVRFISINDNYDSFSTESSNEGLIISLKNILNDIYTKDISKKIIASFKERQSKGEFLGAHVPYGYCRPQGDNYKLIVDEEAATVIRQIYKWKVEGLSDTKIAIMLNDMEIPSPSKYKYLKGEWKNARYNNNIWQRQAIKTITENEVYLGHKIYGKIQASLYEGKKKSRVSKENWIIIENDHEAIIDRETFGIVHNMRMKVHEEFSERLEKNKCYKNKENIFKDVAICGDCKHNLLRRRQIRNEKVTHYFLCSTYQDNDGLKCIKKTITEKSLTEVVFTIIKNYIETMTNIENTIKKVNASKKYQNDKENLQNEINKINVEIKRKDSLRLSIYDDYLEGILTEQEYLYGKSKYEKEKEKLKNKLDELQIQKIKFEETYTLDNKWISTLRNFQSEDSLTTEMVIALIDKVEVYSNKQVKVILKFKDEFDKLIQYLHSLGIEVKGIE